MSGVPNGAVIPSICTLEGACSRAISTISVVRASVVFGCTRTLRFMRTVRACASSPTRARSATMPATLIRRRAMITRTIDRFRWEEIADGAVLQEDGVITAVGTYADLKRKHPKAPVL